MALREHVEDADRKLIDSALGNADSRLKGYGQRVTHPVLPLEKVFCANCGIDYGWVSTESYETIKVMNIIVICEACEEVLGKPNLVEAKIERVR